MKNLKSINLGSMPETLDAREMKSIVGGYDGPLVCYWQSTTDVVEGEVNYEGEVSDWGCFYGHGAATSADFMGNLGWSCNTAEAHAHC